MRNHRLPGVFAGAAMLLAPIAAEAAECYPPQRTCGDDVPYRCPPCPPGGSPALVADQAKLEQYRVSLEVYRKTFEAERAAAPAAPLETYRQGINRYREGQSTYREKAQESARSR